MVKGEKDYKGYKEICNKPYGSLWNPRFKSDVKLLYSLTGYDHPFLLIKLYDTQYVSRLNHLVLKSISFRVQK